MTQEILGQETSDDMRFKLKYAIAFGIRLARLLVHCQWLARIIALMSATAAMAFYGGQFPAVYVALGGALLALLTILEIVIDPGRLAEICREHVRTLADLEAQSEQLPLTELRARWARMTRPDLPQCDALTLPVWNEVVTRLDLADAARPLSLVQRLTFALA